MRNFLLGMACGAALLLYFIGRSMGTPERPLIMAGDEEQLPEFDPYLWQERMK